MPWENPTKQMTNGRSLQKPGDLIIRNKSSSLERRTAEYSVRSKEPDYNGVGRFAQILLRRKNKEILLIALFLLLFFLTRVSRLHNDVINPDGVNWHYRSQMFMNGLKYGDLTKTYQHYHPGVTLMWITGPVIEILRQFPGNNSYNVHNFQGFDFTVKFTLVVVQAVLSVFIIYLLAMLIGFYRALGAVSVFSMEPFFVGNSRLYHLDVLTALFLFIAVIYYYLYKKGNRRVYLILTGLFLSLAFLTKSVSVLFLAVILLMELFGALRKKYSCTSATVSIVLILFIFTVTTFLLLPALWVAPAYYIGELFKEGVRVGIRKGHEQYVFGLLTNDGGLLFYPIVLLMKLSPYIIMLFISGLVVIKKRIRDNDATAKFLVYLAWFYGAYFLMMLLPDKKIDRYMLVMYPFISIVAVLGGINLYTYFERKKRLINYYLLHVVLVSVFLLYPLITLYPYYFAYTSPVFVNGRVANRIIGQKPFGVAVYELKNLITAKYGLDTSLGFIDTKPMESIYPNSLVADIRTEPSSRYKMVILGPNEEIPAGLLKEGLSFTKDSAIYINGLEYWRVYVKRFK